jgi:hypothetical protein
MGRGLIIVLMFVLGIAGSARAQTGAPPSRFANWTSAIVAADWRDGADRPIQAFDNARRDLVKGFLAAGFPRANMVDYSLRPDVPEPTSASAVVDGITAAATRGTAGCHRWRPSTGRTHLSRG